MSSFPSRFPMVAVPTELLWAFIGLILTILGTFVGASITSPPWQWSQAGVQAYPLGVSFQIGAVLLVGCMGGRNAAVLSQIAYLGLGLAGFNVFTYGSGINYFREPSFGYLVGFIPGAWVCGSLALRVLPQLESLAFSCLCGLLTIHVTGLVYLIVAYAFSWVTAPGVLIFQAMYQYSIYPFPGQLAIACAVAVLTYVLRRLMFY
ncbi:MAG: biotin transporter BioY [Leptolyngbyaceae bacterium]|nr:biotin transporter BioY [Leptolyngbyaceae bacterium]